MRFVIILLILLILPVVLQAQEFQFVQEWDSIEVVVDGYTLPAAWRGGYTGTAPDLCDIDGDGDFDIILGSGNYSPPEFWMNNGSSQQESFVFLESGLSGILDQGWTRPEFWDMDADGDLDLFLSGLSDPTIEVYENVGSPDNPIFILLEDTLRDNSGNFIYCEHPALADIDHDGDKDLFCGEYGGFIDYYENIGDSLQYQFYFAETHFESIEVGMSAAPTFCDIDDDGDLDLFVGSEFFGIWYYQNDEVGGQYNFNFMTYNYLDSLLGNRVVPDFCDIDADGDFDLFVGKYSGTFPLPPGDLHFWRNTGTPAQPEFQWEDAMYLTLDFGLGPDIAFSDVNFDSLMDFYALYYNLGWLKNTGSPGAPEFQLMSYDLIGSTFTASSCDFGDLNNDGYEDMVVVRQWSGDMEFWVNNGDTISPGFEYIASMQPGLGAGDVSLGDLDADGDLDMLLSFMDQTPPFDNHIRYYQNQGTPERFDFVLMEEYFQGITEGPSGPALVDFDSDGDLDLMAAWSCDGTIWYYDNQGTPQQPNMVLITEDLLGIPLMISANHNFVDIDNDGDIDVFLGNSQGGIYFFRNVTGEPPSVPPQGETPSHEPFLFLGPNPANPVTWITCQLPYPQKAELAVYNLLGQKVAILASGFMLPGKQTFTWNAGDYPSGVYWIRLKSDQLDAVRKVVVVK